MQTSTKTACPHPRRHARQSNCNGTYHCKPRNRSPSRANSSKGCACLPWRWTLHEGQAVTNPKFPTQIPQGPSFYILTNYYSVTAVLCMPSAGTQARQEQTVKQQPLQHPSTSLLNFSLFTNVTEVWKYQVDFTTSHLS